MIKHIIYALVLFALAMLTTIVDHSHGITWPSDKAHVIHIVVVAVAGYFIGIIQNR